MKIVSFYRFAEVARPEAVAAETEALCRDSGLLGTVFVAHEGVNGTLAGDARVVTDVLRFLGELLQAEAPLEGRWTEAGVPPFRRLRVRVKPEIVALGRPDLRPHESTGTHVPPKAWNALLDRPGTLAIDTRNRYEVEVGSFPGSVDPGTSRFRQFSEFADRLGSADRRRPVAMFCTGGIRCEKASALMLALGFREVYQLQGGILNYLEQMRNDDNRWRGECFVFDGRVAVDRDLAEGGYVQCHACRWPLSNEDLASPDYREGVSCPRCIAGLDTERAGRLEERRRQVALARERGERHIGAVPEEKRRTQSSSR